MNLRAPSDPKLAAQMQGWWPEFSEARRPPGQPTSATPERLDEIARAKATANSARLARAEAKRARSTLTTDPTAAMLCILRNDIKGQP